MSQSERRRQLRQQRRGERLRQLWRFTAFTAAALGLGYALLRYGWVITGPDQIEVVGSRQVLSDQVIQVTGLRFPQPLLSLQPKRLAAELSQALPVDQVQVQRLMAPARLRIHLVDRRAVARAERRGPQGSELGYVDHLGNWMTQRHQAGLVADPALGQLPLVVKGWQPRYRSALALLLSRRPQFGGSLQAIRFEPGGSLWLDTTSLGAVRFGPVDDRLLGRVEVLEHLITQLPPKLKGRRLQSIDLSDPDHPEIALPGPLGPASQAAPKP